MSNTLNIFISYSHKDEHFKEALETQLAILQRNKVISSWSDRKILAGDEWEEEINSNLESAQIILLLISADFLKSEYCYEKEMTRAVERHNNNEAIVIPVIVRPCDWKEGTPFNKLQALPTNALAVSKWDDVDDAWLNVVIELKKKITEINAKKMLPSVQETIWENIISVDFWNWLNDTEIVLTHRKLPKINLDDIFVSPDLKILDEDLDQISKSIDSWELIPVNRPVLVFGDEQSGKTTLAKFLFKEFIQQGYSPVYIDGSEIKSSDITKLIKETSEKQYLKAPDFNDANKKVVIIDNYSNNKLNKKYQNKILNSLKEKYEKIILLSIDSFQYVSPEIESLDEFSFYEILSFGNVKRTELIEKWVSLGAVEEIDEVSLYSEVDEIKLKLEALTRGNILPPKPIYLLSLLQMFESFSPQKLDLTSYGHCYQYLIYQALEKSKIKNSEVDIYINYLTEFGCAQFNNGGKGLNEHQIELFHDDYEKKYLSIDRKKVVNTLLKSGILISRNEVVQFRYSYIYYFFTAKKLAESFSSDSSAKNNIRDLLNNMHREDCANIIIFITHHSKDDWVLDEIQLSLMELFGECNEAKLDAGSLGFMNEFLEEIPELVLEHKKVEEERRRHDSQSEEMERKAAESREQTENLESSDIFAKINKVFKGIEIIGQIIRNRHGSLSKEKLEQLAEQAYGVGLRFLQYFLNISDVSKEEVIKAIENIIRENPSITTDKLEKEARNIFLLLTYSAIYAVLRKVSMSVGSKEAKQIYKNIEKSLNTPAVKLINQAIFLQFNKVVDFKSLRSLAEELKKNPTCERILKQIVIQHIYMFPVKYQEKQQISEVLGIPVADQMMLGHQKQFKM